MNLQQRLQRLEQTMDVYNTDHILEVLRQYNKNVQASDETLAEIAKQTTNLRSAILTLYGITATEL